MMILFNNIKENKCIPHKPFFFPRYSGFSSLTVPTFILFIAREGFANIYIGNIFNLLFLSFEAFCISFPAAFSGLPLWYLTLFIFYLLCYPCLNTNILQALESW
jgi:hypothetical protein